MTFASIAFLLLFLPPVLAGYFGFLWLGRRLPHAWRATVLNLWLFATSLLFYAASEKRLAWVLLFTAAIHYLAGLVIAGGRREPLARHEVRSRLQRAALVTSIFASLVLLGYFKYSLFVADNLFRLANAFGAPLRSLDPLLSVSLPLGISFYTFQAMSYTIDVYEGKIAATRNFLDFTCLITMFPHLIAGPIVRYRDIGPQLRNRRVSLALFASGVGRFIIGLGKKILIANAVATMVDRVFDLPSGQLTTATAWMGTVGYAIQIYFDFSGYSDMAIGLGRMFGFEFKENFAYPYAAESVTDFWRRWHISLSTWVRDYVFIPLGARLFRTRLRTRPRTIAALAYLGAFLVMGAWHGAQWTFVCWGLYYGVILIAEHANSSKPLLRGQLWGRVYTILVVLVGWVLFRAPSLGAAARTLRALIGDGAPGGLGPIAVYLTPTAVIALFAGALGSLPLLPWLNRRWTEHVLADDSHRRRIVELASQFARVTALAAVLVLSFMWLAAGTYNPFIYFRF